MMVMVRYPFCSSHCLAAVRHAASAVTVALVKAISTACGEKLMPEQVAELACQIETEKAIRNIGKILSVEGVDVLFIGPADLSTSLGHRGNWHYPKVEKAISRVLNACKRADVAAGIFAMSIEDAKRYVAQGFRFVALGSDTGFLITGCRMALEALGRGRDGEGRQAHSGR